MDISFIVNPMLVRGLDYYTRTTFEIQTDKLGAQNAVAGGGRYDGLVKQLGGPDHPGMGFAIGVERLVTLLEEDRPAESVPDLFMAALGPSAENKVFQWAHILRKAGLWVEISYSSKGLKPQMKRAGRLAAKKVLIVGDDELAAGKGLLRDMETRGQVEIPLEQLLETLRRVLREKAS
jgi:histidyl-tRNA synthetase